MQVVLRLPRDQQQEEEEGAFSLVEEEARYKARSRGLAPTHCPAIPAVDAAHTYTSGWLAGGLTGLCYGGRWCCAVVGVAVGHVSPCGCGGEAGAGPDGQGAGPAGGAAAGARHGPEAAGGDGPLPAQQAPQVHTMAMPRICFPLGPYQPACLPTWSRPHRRLHRS